MVKKSFADSDKSGTPENKVIAGKVTKTKIKTKNKKRRQNKTYCY
jgi:hypothetical protein